MSKRDIATDLDFKKALMQSHLGCSAWGSWFFQKNLCFICEGQVHRKMHFVTIVPQIAYRVESGGCGCGGEGVAQCSTISELKANFLIYSSSWIKGSRNQKNPREL